MFNTTGEVHHGGIANELKVIDVLNTSGIYNSPVTHKGGTQFKADAYSGDKGISIKRKKSLRVGSYDYVNSTIPVSTLPNVELLKEWKEKTQTLSSDKKDQAKMEFNEISSSILDLVDPDTLTTIVSDGFSKQAGMDIVITDMSTNTIYVMEADNLETPNLISNGYKATIVKTNKIQTSRKIVFVKGKNRIDTGLRIRLTTNNGIGALMGLSKSNSSSSVVVKLQQDGVHNIVSNTPHQTISF